MENVTTPAQPGETFVYLNAVLGRRGAPWGALFDWIPAVFNGEWLSIEPETGDSNAGPGWRPSGAEMLERGLYQMAEGVGGGGGGGGGEQYENLFFRAVAALEWFWAQDVPAPVVVLLMVCVAIFVRTGSVRDFAHFWRQTLLFAAALVWRTPGVVVDLFFTDDLVDSPFPLWIVRFWRGFARGLAGSLYGLLFVAGRRRPLVPPSPPPSPPPTPPQPLTPPQMPLRRGLNAYVVDGDEADDDRDFRRREEYRLEFQRGIARALQRARDHEARAADRGRRGRDGGGGGDGDGDDEPPETTDRTGREPRTLRAEFGYWWPWVRVALGVIVLVGLVLGVVYYCETIEAGEDCGWFTEVVCGGPGVGQFECLGYNDEPIREASVSALPPRFRFLSDGSRVRILDS
ncbi:hypothetical protein F5B21DRAFT_247904 [Xylaria acuta]|nr:hypothetical protein F5B21DRAFT_247904 [Xylaria acuta]